MDNAYLDYCHNTDRINELESQVETIWQRGYNEGYEARQGADYNNSDSSNEAEGTVSDNDTASLSAEDNDDELSEETQ